MKIQLTQTTYTRLNERKSWQEKINSTEKRDISLNEYGLLTNCPNETDYSYQLLKI